MRRIYGTDVEFDLGGAVIVVRPETQLPVPLSEACAGWTGFGVGWDVAKNGNTIQMSRCEFEPENRDRTALLTWTQSAREGGLWYSGELARPLDMPVEAYSAVLSGSADRRFWTSVFASNFTPTRVAFRLGSPVKPVDPSTQEDAETTLPDGRRPYVRLLVSGRRASPPETAGEPCMPDTGSGAQTLNLATIAKTYLTARENGRRFRYGNNWPYRLFEDVNDADGKALMECDTLALMALIGMRYEDSPYANTAANATADFDAVIAAWTATNAANGIPWFQMSSDQTVQLVKQIDGAWINGLGGRIIDQGAMAWWLWDNGCVFRPMKTDEAGKKTLDLTQLRSGDLVLFRRIPCRMFDNVGHIGVIDVDPDGTVYVIHVTLGSWTGGDVVVRSRLEDEFFALAPGRYRMEDAYFARIPYGSTGTVAGSRITEEEDEDE